MLSHKLATPLNPLEKSIQQAMKRQGCTAADLADLVGMAPTNFSLARNLKRSFPLSALLKLLELADLNSDQKIRVIEWLAVLKAS